MNKSLLLAFATLFTLATVPAFAATAPAEKKPAAKYHYVLGQVVSVNAADNSFVVRESLKDKSTKEITFNTGPETKITMGGKKADFAKLAAGETVRVAYQTADGKNVAESVSIMRSQKAAKATKPARKAAAPAATSSPAPGAAAPAGAPAQPGAPAQKQ